MEKTLGVSKDFSFATQDFSISLYQRGLVYRFCSQLLKASDRGTDALLPYFLTMVLSLYKLLLSVNLDNRGIGKQPMEF